MKGVFVILDGVSDQPCQALGQKTPLQAAKTPNLDAIAHNSQIGHCYTIKEGVVPGSDNAIISLLGYNPMYEKRGPLEAKGIGIKMKRGDVAFRCNFATIDDLTNRNILDRRAGRTLTTEEARILARAINEKVKLPFPFVFCPAVQHRGVLIIRGGFSDNITNVEAGKNEKLEFSNSLDGEEDSQMTANLVNSFARQSFEILDRHPVNLARAKKGLYSANVIMCRGAGNEPAEFKKLKGKWMALGYMPLEIGIASATGMDNYSFKYPRMRDIDVYANLYFGLKLAIKYAIKMLKKYKERYDYFYVHFKETDVPGHDNKPHDKVQMIEMIDERFFSFLKNFIGDKKLIVTADHTTACRMKAHTEDAVPVLICPFEKHDDKRFTEEEGMKGRKISAGKLLENHFFKK